MSHVDFITMLQRKAALFNAQLWIINVYIDFSSSLLSDMVGKPSDLGM